MYMWDLIYEILLCACQEVISVRIASGLSAYKTEGEKVKQKLSRKKSEGGLDRVTGGVRLIAIVFSLINCVLM